MNDATAAAAHRILVVEDDPWIRRMVCWALEEEGLASDEAADGRMAVGYLNERRPALVLLDIGLPLVDGYGVAAALHASYGEQVPIVVMTANGRAQESAARVGAAGFVAKPFDMTELLEIVQQLLRGAAASIEPVGGGGT